MTNKEFYSYLKEEILKFIPILFKQKEIDLSILETINFISNLIENINIINLFDDKIELKNKIVLHYLINIYIKYLNEKII